MGPICQILILFSFLFSQSVSLLQPHTPSPTWSQPHRTPRSQAQLQPDADSGKHHRSSIPGQWSLPQAADQASRGGSGSATRSWNGGFRDSKGTAATATSRAGRRAADVGPCSGSEGRHFRRWAAGARPCLGSGGRSGSRRCVVSPELCVGGGGCKKIPDNSSCLPTCCIGGGASPPLFEGSLACFWWSPINENEKRDLLQQRFWAISPVWWLDWG